ncbi:hypothetical protein [Chitinimonas sp. BJB300]|uniref:hypothetical protein n=1 Tax=Chitinimonas sp. BJB300 TaxID=1559339 RepID=UPI000C0DA872|nr:hypothetical protein [Chitinimonas sp. BJB300]PHV12216.1 hypothetical protein CSQ89_06720 [Chitinimonas sp. BJB300]TSJ85191.1 hypothetical protein FG002_017990 [Chitinimonas sp. BJB300]
MGNNVLTQSLSGAMRIAERIGLIAQDWEVSGTVSRIGFVPHFKAARQGYYIVLLNEPLELIRIPTANLANAYIEALALTTPGDEVNMVISGNQQAIVEGNAKMIAFTNHMLVGDLERL